MARIERFTSRVDAEMACSMLNANGIAARVSADDAGGVHPDIPFGIGGTAVVVPDDQLEDARALLAGDDDHDVRVEEPPAAPVSSGGGSSPRRWIILVAFLVAAVIAITALASTLEVVN